MKPGSASLNSYDEGAIIIDATNHLHGDFEFHARIEDCDCGNTNICDRYLYGNFEFIWMQPYLNRANCPDNSNQNWEPISYYPEEYNAYKVNWGIFGDNGGQVAGGFMEDKCNGIPKGFIKWDGMINGQNAPGGTYTYFIELENCLNSKVLEGSFDVGNI